MSKYNYIVFLFVFVVALASLPAGRRVLGDRRIVLSAGLFLLLTAPHIHWIWRHQDIALRRVPDLHSPAQLGLLRSWLGGLVSLVERLKAAGVSSMLLLTASLLGAFFMLRVGLWQALSRLPVEIKSAFACGQSMLINVAAAALMVTPPPAHWPATCSDVFLPWIDKVEPLRTVKAPARRKVEPPPKVSVDPLAAVSPPK